MIDQYPWAVYRALMSGCIIVLNKNPRVWPGGMGETWQRLAEFFCHVGIRPRGIEVLRTGPYMWGVEARIGGGIYVMHILWQKNSQEEDWGFLLIDGHNEFNKENQTSMMWNVQYEWPSGAWFALNFYHYWTILVVRDVVGSVHFLHR